MRKIATGVLIALALTSCAHGRHSTHGKTPTVGTREPVLNYDTKAIAEPELADLAVVLPPPEVNADWAQPGGSPSKSMGHLSLPDTLTKAWSASIGKGSDASRRLNAPPMVYGNRVFTIDVAGTVRLFDTASGKTTWTQRIVDKGEDEHSAFGGGVSASDGRVFAATGYGLVVAFDFNSGKELWRVNLNTTLRGAPAISGATLFVRSGDNQLFSLNVATGATNWSVSGTTEPAGILGGGAPAIALDTVVTGYSSGELNAMRVENGRTVWADALARTGRTTAINALTDIDASPVIDRGRVFAIGHGGRMAALELATGQRVWERNFAGISTPWLAGDFVYVVTLDAQVICLTRGEGKIRWVTQLPHYKDKKKKAGAYGWFGPVLASDRLIVTGSNKTMVTISPYTGKILSSVKLSAPAYLPPVVANNQLYVLTDNGKLTMYR
jgi:outer membrane protein assembly factor BamB